MDKKIRILFITHYSDLYGANRSLLDIIVGLKKFPMEIIVLMPTPGDLSKKLNYLKIEWMAVPFSIPFEYKWISKNKFYQFYHDLRHVITAMIRWFNNKKCLKKIFVLPLIDSIDLIFSNSSVITIGQELSVKMNIPHVHQIRELPKFLHLFPDFGETYYYKKIFNSKLLIFNSNYTKRNFLKIDQLPTSVVIYNEIKSPPLCKTISLSSEIFKIGVFGYLNSQKNQAEAIEAIAQINSIPNLQLFLVGGGDLDFYRKISEEFGVNEKVNLVGFTDNIAGYYEAMDVIVVSAKNEALGRVTIEAMLSKKCVIGKRSGATPEIIEDLRTGLLYDSYKDLADKLLMLYQNPELRNVLALNAYKYSVTKFSSGQSIKKLYSEFEKLVNEV